MRSFLRILSDILIIALVVVMAYSGYQLYLMLSEYHESDVTYQESANTYSKPTDDAEKCPITVDFDELTAVNPDVVGWIYCEDSQVNYPVLHAEDNDKYLHMMYNGEYNKAGSIFMDCANNPDLSDLNTLIYGHHMKNGSMFAMLHEYRSQEFYEGHKVFWYLTPVNTYKLYPIAGYVGDSVAEVYSHFTEPEQLDSYLAFAFSHSDFQADYIPKVIDRIVVLSTCAYEFEDARYVVICVPELFE